ncbi:MAG: Fe-S cluster assembly protein SufB [Acidimicrobiia bacterium]|nr:Fe-S cluster assembly protein SufB [Acidimicrobiia bacterium]
MATTDLDLGRYKLGWSDKVDYLYEPKKGLNEDVVRQISEIKGEPEWMTKFRLRALKIFERKPMAPWFAVNMPKLDFQDIYYYLKPTGKQVDEWDALPESMKQTYEKLGIPEAERKYLAGVTAQYECLRGSTQVWTTEGFKRIKELGAGDEVFSLDEETRQIVRANVVAQQCSGEKEVFEIRACGRVIGASANHPVLVVTRNEMRWVPVEQLAPGDDVAIATEVPVTRRRTYSDPSDGSAVAVLERPSMSLAVETARIDSIESVGVEPVYDIEVAGHHNFVAEGFVVHNSEVVYHKNREDLAKQGILFSDMDTALREHPDIVQKYFGTIIPPGDNKFAALNSAVWSGGCLTASARINVKGRGLVGIADIRAGDEVFGLDPGRNVVRGKVLDRIESGVKPVYRMRVAGRTLEATGNHKFLVARRVEANGRQRWTAVWVPLNEIEIGEPLAIPRVLPDDGESAYNEEPEPYIKNRWRETLGFPFNSSPELLWLLGLWMGDGHTAAPHEHMRQISFSVPDSDPVKAHAIAALGRVFGVQHVTHVNCGFVVSSKQLGLWLEKVGFHGHAKTKRVPRWVFALPHEEQLAFLGGLIDADGCSENDGKTMSIELANEGLLEDLRQIAIACGLSADGQLTKRTRTVRFRDGHEVTATCWRLRIHGDVARIGTRDPSKRGAPMGKWRGNRYIQTTGLNYSSLCTPTVGFSRLEEKTPVGDEPTYDIQVIGLENFVANGIVAHNSFIYVPPGVKVEMPLQAYFRINQENAGQFERTLIIADEGAQVHYIEGCSAPVYSTDSLHSAVVELIAKPGARITYTTIQNWSPNVYNLVTKRAKAETEARVEWIDGNIGSRLTMKYPSVYLMGPKATGEVLSVAYAGPGQHQDAGAKMIHAAPETSSTIVSKSISKDGGRTSYRGLVKVEEGSHGVRSHVRCDALILDEDSRSDTYPYMEINEQDARIGHEATVSKVGEDQLFYLMSRGLSEQQAMGMIVNGFIEPVTRTLPMEYAVEWSRLIELQMEGAVG